MRRAESGFRVSTWARDRDESFRKDHADGFVVLLDDKGPRIVADAIGFTNENKVDPSGRWLYVHETMGRSIQRFPIRDNNSLGPRETAAAYGPGIFPDGFEFDAEGGIWCTSVVSNRIVRIAADGTQHIVFDGGDQDLIERAEAAYQNGSYTPCPAERGPQEHTRQLRKHRLRRYGPEDLLYRLARLQPHCQLPFSGCRRRAAALGFLSPPGHPGGRSPGMPGGRPCCPRMTHPEAARRRRSDARSCSLAGCLTGGSAGRQRLETALYQKCRS